MNQQELLNYFNQTLDFIKINQNRKLRYFGIIDFMLQHGQFFQPYSLPNEIKFGKKRLCYNNATDLALSNIKYIYCEGYAVTEIINIPIYHAWTVDENNTVFDNTWDPCGTLYFGVKFNTNFLFKHLLKTKEYGILSEYMPSEWCKNGIPNSILYKKKELELLNKTS